ncbi:MAG: hypothetical protein ACM3IH_05810, partial [Sphingobacteriales bacterium]
TFAQNCAANRGFQRRACNADDARSSRTYAVQSNQLPDGSCVPMSKRAAGSTSIQAYERFLVRHGVDPARAAMFEDLARNLETPHMLGMTTVLVVPEGQREVFREAWELEGRDRISRRDCAALITSLE